MVIANHNIKGYTPKEAADIVGVTPTRIRQLTSGDEPIDHEKFLGRLIITPKGLKQAKERNTKIGRKPKTTAPANGNAK